jgi:RNA polymerase sigma-70 factor, ECF subfamily
MLGDQTDDELMRLVKQGSEPAFTLLFKRHSSAVFGLCMRFFSGNRSRAEDVSQEVWAKVVRYARTYEPSGKFKAWLMQVTRNSALREIEKNQVVYQMTHEDDVDIADSFNLEDSIAESHRESEVKAAIDELPESQRTALVLWIDGSRSYEDIAKELKGTVSGVKSLLFRARQALVKRLGEEK